MDFILLNSHLIIFSVNRKLNWIVNGSRENYYTIVQRWEFI